MMATAGRVPHMARPAIPATLANTATQIDRVARGWRVEQNGHGYWRWRWQKKTATGQPVKYKTKSGRVGYRRGSKYIGKSKPIEVAK